MKNFVLRLTMLMLLFVSGNVTYADDTQCVPKCQVVFKSNVEVVSGRSYTGRAVAWIYYKNGLTAKRPFDIIIDYGLCHKHIVSTDFGSADYDSSCQYLIDDDIAKFYAAELFGSENVKTIVIEMNIKKWN